MTAPRKYHVEVNGASEAPAAAVVETQPPAQAPTLSGVDGPSLINTGAALLDQFPSLKGWAVHEFLKRTGMSTAPAQFEATYRANKDAIDKYVSMISIKGLTAETNVDDGIASGANLIVGLGIGVLGTYLFGKFNPFKGK